MTEKAGPARASAGARASASATTTTTATATSSSPTTARACSTATRATAPSGTSRRRRACARRPPLGHRLHLRRLRPRRRPRPRGDQLPRVRSARRFPSRAAAATACGRASPVMCGPRGLPFARNRLFRNDGDGPLHGRVRGQRYRRRPSAATGSPSSLPTSTTTAIPTSTSPATRRPACSTTTSATGRSRRSGLLSGVALNEDGQEQGGMGVAVADFDEDGHFDIVKTNFSDDVPTSTATSGDGTFEDRVFRVGPGRLHGVRRLGRAAPGRRSRRAPGPAHGQRPRLSGGRAEPGDALPPAAAAVLERRRRALQGHLGPARGPAITERLVVARARPPATSTTTARSRS